MIEKVHHKKIIELMIYFCGVQVELICTLLRALYHFQKVIYVNSIIHSINKKLKLV